MSSTAVALAIAGRFSVSICIEKLGKLLQGLVAIETGGLSQLDKRTRIDPAIDDLLEADLTSLAISLVQ
ncbi:hypothetical protein [Rhizobium sp. BK068]|uniref:hypothetical protein n=1 Tax=Rhizobium sp. BK068 TaxID=2512130 RepID=UPI00104C67DD|nr:hypothetical protein [Rhizobium sp. BK068]